ncbi:MATE family efflux transporter [Sphingosinicella sp. LHD-64]|uniref:MATE family efflux transporter n=1 Tax=Sphingosinicella sp. LHD-64 TaxID=3072139 RepID=UPI00280C9535|nr:MATE family efflux transporter [Sphingosinicella sp. LHD-64]MDQ8754877.1 MATE family efflux transporter [Sphingosinicella sp. LHD-64]
MGDERTSAPTASRPGQRDLTTGPIGPVLLAFAVPTLISSVLQSLNGSINAIWVGRFLGEDALAATSNANMTMFLLMAFVFGFGMAATVLIGQAFGRHDLAEVRRVTGTVIGAFVPVAAAIGLLGWIFAPDLLRILATPPDAVPLALAYLRVIFIAMPPILLATLLVMSLRGAGDAMTPLWFMIVAVVLDSGLNPVFILGLGPVPAMGIAGSAMATVVANYVALIGLIVFIYRRDLPIRLRGAELRLLWPDRALLGIVVRKGVPMGLQMIVVSASALAALGLVNREGVHTTAAFGVVLQLWAYIQMPAMALAAAVSAMVAQNIGAGRWDRVGKVTRAGILYNLAITGSLVVVLAVADRPALALFLGGESPALPIARHIQLLVTWSFLLFGVTMILFGTVRANGAVLGPLIIFAIGLFPIRLGFAVGAYPWLGADALWLSFPVSALANMAMAIAFYLHGGWRESRMMAPPPVTELEEEAQAVAEPGGRLNPSG